MRAPRPASTCQPERKSNDAAAIAVGLVTRVASNSENEKKKKKKIENARRYSGASGVDVAGGSQAKVITSPPAASYQVPTPERDFPGTASSEDCSWWKSAPNFIISSTCMSN